VSDPRIVGCETCRTEGILRHFTHSYIDHRNGGIVECGSEEDCPWCEGTGGEIIETQPITLEDLEVYAPC
jgi:hypothetical protein